MVRDPSDRPKDEKDPKNATQSLYGKISNLSDVKKGLKFIMKVLVKASFFM